MTCAICDNCGRDHDSYQQAYWLRKDSRFHNGETFLCSPSCLVEWAWKLKESQEKLSKSKELNINDSK